MSNMSYDSSDDRNTISNTIYCPICGAEMNRKARCCLKCGALNYDHPANKTMKKYSKVKKGKFLDNFEWHENKRDVDMTLKNSSISDSMINNSKITKTEKKYRVAKIFVNILLFGVIGIALYYVFPILVFIFNKIIELCNKFLI